MARESANLLGIALATFLVGAALASDPKCQRGCRTLAEHLIKHGLDEFFRALGA